jgi:DNA polymerase-1
LPLNDRAAWRAYLPGMSDIEMLAPAEAGIDAAITQPIPEPPIRLYLVDGSGYIFRAFHALPPLTRKSDGLPIGAVAGFCNMLWKLICEMKADKPTHLAVVFDASEKTFRSELYPAYKAHRPPPPEDLVPQFPLVREATRAFGVPALELDGYEADDLIATYAREVAGAGGEVVIVSSDKDLMQLVNEQICLLDPVKNVKLCRAEVIEKFGMGPEHVVDIQALAGDPVDNVPGAPGIGIKTAAQLLTEFGDLDTLLARASEIKQPKKRETLIEFADQVRISRELVRLKDDAPMPEPVADLAVRDPDGPTLAAFLEAMEFRTLARRVSEGPSAAPVARPSAPPSPAAVAEAIAIDHSKYVCIRDLDTLDTWIQRAREAGVVGFDTETDALSSATSGLCGISLAVGPGEAAYVPVGHCAADGLDLAAAADWTQIPLREAVERLKPLLEDPAVLKVCQNGKYDIAVMSRYGVRVGPTDDTMLMSYVLEGGLHGHGMDELSQLHLGHIPIPFKQVAGTGKKEISFAQVELPAATCYAAEDADVTLRLWRALKPRLAPEGMATVYETLERGMPAVLAEMECAGIRVDPERLRQLGHEFSLKMIEMEAEAHRQAGRPFNLGSPKQIGDILFGEMGLPGAKKTATGAWATDVKVLEDLADQGHALPRTIVAWRQVSKLKNTYTDALTAAANPQTHRVHTSFSLAAAATGRLASTDPNLQNIPIRTEEGRKLRTCFIADPGNVLISADYSQIELRLLAHIGDIPQLKDAFRQGLDIHAMTASEMFDTPIEGMPGEIRRRAKAINFGIVYGISAFGLANQLGIEQSEAAAYIKTYFERFPGIRDYMNEARTFVREHGFVQTIFGRKVHIPAIRGKSPAERSFGERAAINAPIQGAAADIIRRAMIRMPGALKAEGLQARMLLQVHDELIFEAPQAEAERVCAVAKAVMEKAAEPAVALSVPLVVEARAALNWDEAH